MKALFNLLLGVLFSISAFGQPKTLDNLEAKTLDETASIETIAFGSCNNQEKKQSMWKYICRNRPDLWVWLGDNIYGDTENMALMASKYEKVKNAPGYKILKSISPVIGIWDDHDYGVNDGDKNYPRKIESKNLMLEFLDVPLDADVRKREGDYQSFLLGEGENKVKIILLDTRYFRDTLTADTISNQRYIPNRTGDVLGDVQWEWLEKELTNSDARLHLIGSSIQVISEEHFFEKWANFPLARTRFLDLLVKTKVKNAVILSGDRHIAEISRMDLQGLDYSLYDITASGLTHTYKGKSEESNRWRSGKLLQEKNFGIIKINWSEEEPILTIEVRGEDNDLFMEQQINFNSTKN